MTACALQCLDSDLAAADHRHLPRFQKDHAAGVLHDGRRVAGDKILAFTQPDHHAARIADPGRHDLIRLVGRHQHDHVGALDLLERLPRGLHQDPMPVA